ncbi:hypothetical protein [Streptomyces rhizosphaericus]|uniref:Uncharacterized protein n=1 Tax=Streptomyces rhizosphaericus TaxID=114699 RepID=A0ABN1RYD0_9ACTN
MLPIFISPVGPAVAVERVVPVAVSQSLLWKTKLLTSKLVGVVVLLSEPPAGAEERKGACGRGHQGGLLRDLHGFLRVESQNE